jgi:acetylornithine/N-succinyldiaminopimelate aminotransferase
MSKELLIKEAEENILHTYNRFQVVFDHGDGVYLYDNEGRKYLDFAAGIAVMALGYNNKEYNDALKAQIDKLIHTSNLYYNEPIIKASERILKVSGMDRVFFTNSGDRGRNKISQEICLHEGRTCRS